MLGYRVSSNQTVHPTCQLHVGDDLVDLPSGVVDPGAVKWGVISTVRGCEINAENIKHYRGQWTGPLEHKQSSLYHSVLCTRHTPVAADAPKATNILHFSVEVHEPCLLSHLHRDFHSSMMLDIWIRKKRRNLQRNNVRCGWSIKSFYFRRY